MQKILHRTGKVFYMPRRLRRALTSRGFAVRHTETTISRSQRCAGSASTRGCHIAEITISGVRTGSSKL
jgi:hypothetical protein